MRRLVMAPLSACFAFALLPISAHATERLQLTPPGLIADLVREDRLAQDYDEAFDEGEEYEEEAPSSAESKPKKKRTRKRSSSQRARSSSSNSGGGGGYASYGGGGGVAPMGKTFGVGIQFGLPTAVTGKFMLTPESGVVVGVGAGYGFFYNPAVSLSLHADYVYHPTLLFENDGVKLSWFIGGGGWIGLLGQGNRAYREFVVPPFNYGVYGSPLFLAARLPIGISLALQSIPAEFYLEAVPALNIFPAISFGIGVDLGFRFYF